MSGADPLIALAWIVFPVLGPLATIAMMVAYNGRRRSQGKAPISGWVIAILAAATALLGAALAFATCTALIVVGPLH